MYYSIIIYAEDGAYERLPSDIQDTIMQGHGALQEALTKRGKFATMKLMPVSSAVTVEPVANLGDAPLIVDGPFAETKEQFLGLYAAEFSDLDEAIEYAKYLASPYARIEVRPVSWAGGMFGDSE